MKPQRFLYALTCSAICLTPVLSFAQPSATTKPALDETAKPRARQPFAEGKRLFHQAEEKKDPKLFLAAYREFKMAYAIYPSDNTLFNLAASEVRAGMVVEGMRHLREYVRRVGGMERVSPEERAIHASLSAEAAPKTSLLRIDAPAGSTVLVDGQPLDGVAPLADVVDVLPGKHVVEAKLDTAVKRADVTAAAGQRVTVDLTATTAPAPAVAPVVPVGPVAEAPAAAPQETRVEAPAADTGAKRSESAVKVVVSASLLAGGIAGIALGTGFLLGAGTAEDEREQLRANGSCARPSPACDEIVDATDRRVRNTNTGAALLVGGAALTAGALAVWFFLPPSRDASASAPRAWRFVPSVSATGVNAQLTGTF